MRDQKNILFIQGGGNGGYEADKKLADSLQSSLGNGYAVHYPEIHPVESEPDYGWPEQIAREILKSKNDLIIVGHSFGASMILKCLSENTFQQTLKGVFLISTPFWSGNEDWVKGLMLKGDFANQLPANLPIFFYHAKDDEEVPFSHLNSYRSTVESGHYREIDKGGHQLNNDLSIVAKDIKDSPLIYMVTNKGNN